MKQDQLMTTLSDSGSNQHQTEFKGFNWVCSRNELSSAVATSHNDNGHWNVASPNGAVLYV